MSPRENIPSDSGQIEKARQDLLLACREAADRAQQEQERQREQQQEQERTQEQQRKSFFEAPQKPQETPPELNFETTQADDEKSVITIEQSVPAETDEISTTVQNQRQKMIPSYRSHNPFVEDLLKKIVSEDIDRLRRQLANKP